MHSADPDTQAEAGTQLRTLPAAQRLKTHAYVDFHSAFHGARRQRTEFTESEDVAALSQHRAIAGATVYVRSGKRLVPKDSQWNNSRGTFLIKGSPQPPGTLYAPRLAKLFGSGV